MLTIDATTMNTDTKPALSEAAIASEARKNVLRGLLAGGMTQEDALNVLAEAETGASASALVKAARELHASDDVNIDRNALFSASTEGVWVSAWVWVPNSKAGLPDAPLPAEFAGKKLWSVTGESGASIDAEKHYALGRGFVVRPIETLTDALAEMDASDKLVMAESEQDAATIASLWWSDHASIEEREWASKDDDDCVLWYLARVAPAAS